MNMIPSIIGAYLLAIAVVTTLVEPCYAWQGTSTRLRPRVRRNYANAPSWTTTRPSPLSVRHSMVKPGTDGEDMDVKSTKRVEEYKNFATAFLSNFIPQESDDTADSFDDNSPLSRIDWDAPKISSSTSMETLAAALDYDLSEREWFVTGDAVVSYFSDDFEFQDPDVKLSGIKEYCVGVNKLFNQETSRAEILSTVVNTTASTATRPVITCTWRLSGGVDIGPGITIKPYIVYTDFVVDPQTMLIAFQEDRFSIPSWDILVSSLFPFLIGRVTSPAAPPVEPRSLVKPRIKLEGQQESPLAALQSFFVDSKR